MRICRHTEIELKDNREAERTVDDIGVTAEKYGSYKIKRGYIRLINRNHCALKWEHVFPLKMPKTTITKKQGVSLRPVLRRVILCDVNKTCTVHRGVTT